MTHIGPGQAQKYISTFTHLILLIFRMEHFDFQALNGVVEFWVAPDVLYPIKTGGFPHMRMRLPNPR